MIIGIDGSRAFVKERTGVEEYSYQVIKNLRNIIKNHQARLAPASSSQGGSTSGDLPPLRRIEASESRRVVLYLKKDQQVDFDLPRSWTIKIIDWPMLWTQMGLSLEMLFNPIDALFIPAHTVPVIHPENTIVTVHGLEFEILPESYSFWERIYMRLVIKKSCLWAKNIIAVSQNTKKDLVNLYKVPPEKIKVIYEGAIPMENYPSKADQSLAEKFKIKEPYLLFVGRLETRKNIIGILRAFEILKERYKIPHKLVLAGKFGYGKNKISKELSNINFNSDVILTGFVSQEEKEAVLKRADVFLFPTFYEGFGLPVLEAQNAGVPVVAGNNSSILEIASENSAILVDPHNAEDIADAVYKIISDENFRNGIIGKGRFNAQRFSWEKCAEEIAKLLNS